MTMFLLHFPTKAEASRNFICADEEPNTTWFKKDR